MRLSEPLKFKDGTPRFSVGSVRKAKRFDMVCELKARNMHHIIEEHLLPQLSVPDMVRCQRVSRLWRQVIQNSATFSRVGEAKAKVLAIGKENNARVMSADRPTNKRTNVSNTRRSLGAMTNCVYRICSSGLSPESPASTSPVYIQKSPSKFDLFMKIGTTLKADCKMYRCPECKYPALLVKTKEKWLQCVCQRLRCQHKFCPDCEMEPHDPSVICQRKLGGVISNDSSAITRLSLDSEPSDSFSFSTTTPSNSHARRHLFSNLSRFS